MAMAFSRFFVADPPTGDHVGAVPDAVFSESAACSNPLNAVRFPYGLEMVNERELKFTSPCTMTSLEPLSVSATPGHDVAVPVLSTNVPTASNRNVSVDEYSQN